MAITTLSTVLSIDFKSSDLEIAFVNPQSATFRSMTSKEIEAHLTRITEKD